MKNNRVKFVGVLTVLMFVAATQAAYYLPTTNDIWHGSQIYTEGGYHAYIEYAVYRTASAPASVVNPSLTTGTYTYAYKIMTASDSETVATFKLFSLDNLDLSSNDEGYVADSTNVAPDNSYNNGQDIIWEFLGGTFDAGKTSVNLVFTSDFAPVEGDLDLYTTTGDGTATPGATTQAAATDSANSLPEPTTIALLSFGVLAFRKVRRS